METCCLVNLNSKFLHHLTIGHRRGGGGFLVQFCFWLAAGFIWAKTLSLTVWWWCLLIFVSSSEIVTSSSTQNKALGIHLWKQTTRELLFSMWPRQTKPLHATKKNSTRQGHLTFYLVRTFSRSKGSLKCTHAGPLQIEGQESGKRCEPMECSTLCQCDGWVERKATFNRMTKLTSLVTIKHTTKHGWVLVQTSSPPPP